MLSVIISSVCSIISGMVLFLLQHYIKQRHSSDTVKEKEAREKDILILKSLNALGKLAMSNSSVINSAEKNETAKFALDEYTKVNNEMVNFLIENSSNKKE